MIDCPGTSSVAEVARAQVRVAGPDGCHGQRGLTGFTRPLRRRQRVRQRPPDAQSQVAVALPRSQRSAAESSMSRLPQTE